MLRVAMETGHGLHKYSLSGTFHRIINIGVFCSPLSEITTVSFGVAGSGAHWPPPPPPPRSGSFPSPIKRSLCTKQLPTSSKVTLESFLLFSRIKTLAVEPPDRRASGDTNVRKRRREGARREGTGGRGRSQPPWTLTFGTLGRVQHQNVT